jgi:hypothetical protein
MRQVIQSAERLAIKSDAHTLSRTLITRYDMSIAEAECLTQELRQKQAQEDPAQMLDGQVFYTAVAITEPAGKQLSKCKTIRIHLTLHAPEDLTYRAKHGLRAYQRLLVSRLCYEAYGQGALLAQEDLCRLLYLSRATIQRMLAEYRQAGDYIPTRGNYHDIGPAVSHKYQAVRLYLRGLQPTMIARRLCHNLNSIERYLIDFCRVMGAVEAGFEIGAIARFTGCSPRLVSEYCALYDEFKQLADYQESLQALRRRALALGGAKKGGLL